MITVTEAAQKEIVKLMENQKTPLDGVRVKAEAISPLKANYRLAFVEEDEKESDDHVESYGAFKIYVDPGSLDYVQDITIDFVDGVMGRGFKIENPNRVPPHLKGTVAEKVQEVIDEKITPGVASHGGNVSLIDVKDGIAYVQFGGGCQGCGMVKVTLKEGVEVALKEAVPEINEVIDITDHADGRNPYYQPPKA